MCPRDFGTIGEDEIHDASLALASLDHILVLGDDNLNDITMKAGMGWKGSLRSKHWRWALQQSLHELGFPFVAIDELKQWNRVDAELVDRGRALLRLDAAFHTAVAALGGTSRCRRPPRTSQYPAPAGAAAPLDSSHIAAYSVIQKSGFTAASQIVTSGPAASAAGALKSVEDVVRVAGLSLDILKRSVSAIHDPGQGPLVIESSAPSDSDSDSGGRRLLMMSALGIDLHDSIANVDRKDAGDSSAFGGEGGLGGLDRLLFDPTLLPFGIKATAVTKVPSCNTSDDDKSPNVSQVGHMGGISPDTEEQEVIVFNLPLYSSLLEPEAGRDVTSSKRKLTRDEASALRRAAKLAAFVAAGESV